MNFPFTGRYGHPSNQLPSMVKNANVSHLHPAVKENNVYVSYCFIKCGDYVFTLCFQVGFSLISPEVYRFCTEILTSGIKNINYFF